VVALAGIAEPARFEAALTAAGWTVSRLLTFADHHRYGRGDLDHMAAAVGETGATGVVTTGKDAIRLRWMRPLPFACAAVPLDVSIEPSAVFRPWLFDRLREARQ
jgi:tetraacyldisaccharide-1-P 4'-kinase